MLNKFIGTKPPADLHEGEGAYKNGGKVTIKLDESFFVHGYTCRLELTHTNGANPVFNDPKLFSAFDTISIVANGNEHLKTLTPYKVFINELKHFQKLADYNIDTTPNATVTSYVTFVIPFTMMNMVRGHDTILNTANFSSLNMFVQWSAKTALGADITIDSGTLGVNSMAIENYVYDKGENIKYFIENSIDIKPVTSNNDTFQLEVPNDKIYKSLYLAAYVDGKMNDDVIENIIVKAGSKVFLDWNAKILRSKNIRELRLIDESLIKGHYIIDPTQRGKITDSYNIDRASGGYNKLTIILKVKKGAGDTFVALSSDEFVSTAAIPNP